jgi:hypothetical protein
MQLPKKLTCCGRLVIPASSGMSPMWRGVPSALLVSENVRIVYNARDAQMRIDIWGMFLYSPRSGRPFTLKVI